MRRRHFIAGSAALLGAPLLLRQRAARAQALEKITLAVGGDGLQYISLWTAIGGNFFKNEGLQAEVVDLNSGPRQVAAVLGGSAELSTIGMIQVIKAQAQGGVGLIAVSAFLNTLDLLVVLSNDALARTGILPTMPIDDKVRRLKDLRIGITGPGGTTDVFIRTLLKIRGVDPDKALQLQPVGGGGNMLAAFEKGAIDGFVWSAPQPQIVESRALGKIVINCFTGEVPEIANVPYQGLVTSRDTLKQKPALIRKAIRAFARANAFLIARPDEASRIVQAHFSAIPAPIFDACWRPYLKGIPKSPLISAQQVENVQKWVDVTSPGVTHVKYTDVVDDSVARQVASEVAAR